MARRYSYTPRRNGDVPRRRPRPLVTADNIDSYAPLFIPLAVAVVLVAFGFFVSQGSADFPGGVPCTGTNCAPLVAGESATPLASVPAAAAEPGDQKTGPGVIGDEPAPAIDGFAAAVIEAPCGARLYGLSEGLALAPASLTKMMTAIVALERGNPDDLVDVTIDGGEISLANDTTAMGLKPGDRLPLIDLVYGLILRSAHDAALAIAEHIAGDEPTFVGLMNEKAAQLGLAHTSFANTSGLDDPNLYTTAYDMARLGNYLLQNATLAEIVATREYQPAWDRGPLENLNLHLNNYPNAAGVKTGFTEQAAQTIVASADKDGRRLIASVLHTEDMYVDAALLLDWAFANTAPAC